LVIRDSLNHLRIHNHRATGDPVRNKLAHLNTPEENRKSPLLVKRDAVQFEQHSERVFINLFVQTVAKFVQDLESKANDLFRFSLQQQLRLRTTPQIWSFIRVHPWLSLPDAAFQTYAQKF